MTKYNDYVLVMVANGMHFTGQLVDSQSAAFGRVELTDLMSLLVNQKGEIGLNNYMFPCKKITMYPILIVKFEDLEQPLYKGLTAAYVQKHSKIQLVQQ